MLHRDELLQPLSDGFGRRDQEHLFGRRIENHDAMVLVHADNAVHGSVDDRLVAFARFAVRLVQAEDVGHIAVEPQSPLALSVDFDGD